MRCVQVTETLASNHTRCRVNHIKTGLIDRNQSAVEIAASEVHEECGYQVSPESLVRIAIGREAVGVSGSRLEIFCADIQSADHVAEGMRVAPVRKLKLYRLAQAVVWPTRVNGLMCSTYLERVPMHFAKYVFMSCSSHPALTRPRQSNLHLDVSLLLALEWFARHKSPLLPPPKHWKDTLVVAAKLSIPREALLHVSSDRTPTVPAGRQGAGSGWLALGAAMALGVGCGVVIRSLWGR